MELIFCGNTGNYFELEISSQVSLEFDIISNIIDRKICMLNFLLFQYWVEWKAKTGTRIERGVSHGPRSKKEYIRSKSRGKNQV